VNPGSVINAGVQIAGTGFYQVTWGYMVTGSNNTFTLEVNGVGSATRALEVNGQTLLGSITIMSSITNIVQVTVNPTILRVVNTNGNATLRTAANDTNIVAYLAIIKLQ
jgi:hypothetical protein